MKQQLVNLKVMPYERRIKNNNRFHLKLRITSKAKRKYYGNGFNATNEEWIYMNSLNTKGLLKKIQQDIIILEKEANDCAEAIIPFSFSRFEHNFFAEKIAFENIESAYVSYISISRQNDQEGTAYRYNNAIKSLKKFKTKLNFENVTHSFLQKFEKWI